MRKTFGCELKKIWGDRYSCYPKPDSSGAPLEEETGRRRAEGSCEENTLRMLALKLRSVKKQWKSGEILASGGLEKGSNCTYGFIIVTNSGYPCISLCCPLRLPVKRGCNRPGWGVGNPFP